MPTDLNTDGSRLYFCSAADAGISNVYVWGRGELKHARDAFLEDLKTEQSRGLTSDEITDALSSVDVSNEAPLLAVQSHPPTSELIALDAKGRVFVFSHTFPADLRCKQVTSLAPFDAEAFGPQPEIFLFQHLLGVKGANGLALYLLKTGACVDPLVEVAANMQVCTFVSLLCLTIHRSGKVLALLFIMLDCGQVKGVTNSNGRQSRAKQTSWLKSRRAPSRSVLVRCTWLNDVGAA